MRSVYLLDYGSGNLRSAQRALERVGAQVAVGSDVAAAAAAPGLVVPGVGAFAAVMAALSGVGGARLVRERLAGGRPVLGICVGMQVMFARGLEHGQRIAGLGLLRGDVRRLRAPVVPHMGWNTVRAPEGSALFEGIGADQRFYFVHSYAAPDPAADSPAANTSAGGAAAEAGGSAVPDPAAAAPARVALAEHGEAFIAAVESGALSATQFHPEKSGDAGAALLENWLRSLQ
ncbi:MAG: imidazole glycerol phosphate synthase subunit HisH [Frankiaceae bacterium]|nr:imidazole glycerol phosphate synthase subunit HisH [Frankiaceae bacterium]